MSDALLMLRLEHRNATALLEVLARERAITAAGGAPDRALLDLVMAYFLEFPDRCHHPKEDRIYAAVRARRPEFESIVGDLERDHERLAELTRATARACAEAAGGELAEALDRFDATYRSHMSAEEATFFPYAEQVLTREDWASIDFETFDVDDPLFDQQTEERFAALRETIRSAASDRRHRARLARDERHLSALQGLEDFNRLMADEASALRLVSFCQGGFGVERDGELLARIPPCSPAQAAWAAFGFARGTRHGPRGARAADNRET